MADNPSVLFISSCDMTSDEIIHLILSDVELPEKIKISEDIDAYPYHIDNKYYTTDVNLCCLKRKVLSNGGFASTVQGTVICFDSRDKDCLKVIDSWMPFLREYSPEIQMLVCKNCPEETNDGCCKRTVQEWCIARGFELVELEPITEEDDAEDDFPETTGVSRIVQALNAHVWPNLVMKNKNGKETNDNEAFMDLSKLASQMCLEESVEELLENDDDFSQLFLQLPELKARVSAMQGPERMAAAVQVVKAFWKAMDNDGDDDDDILDL